MLTEEHRPTCKQYIRSSTSCAVHVVAGSSCTIDTFIGSCHVVDGGRTDMDRFIGLEGLNVFPKPSQLIASEL